MVQRDSRSCELVQFLEFVMEKGHLNYLHETKSFIGEHEVKRLACNRMITLKIIQPLSVTLSCYVSPAAKQLRIYSEL